MKYQTNYSEHRSYKIFFIALAVFAFTVCLFVGMFWWGARPYARIAFDEEYFFLVRDCEDTTASAVAGQVYLSGGAGFLMGSGKDSAVVLACYYRESSANQVRESMALKGVETRVLPLSPKDLELNGERASCKAQIRANTQTLDSCARLLYDTANGLERTQISQEEARAALRGAVKSLRGLCEENDEKHFSLWNVALRDMARRGTEVSEGLIFAKDLRYLQVQMCYTVVHIADYFA